MITIVLVVAAIAAVGYVLVSRMRGKAVNVRRLLVLPAVLTVIGGLQVLGEARLGMTATALGLLATDVVVAVLLGVARGATVAVSAREGRAWLRYRPLTLALWVATIIVRLGMTALAYAVGAAQAAGGPALLLCVGVTLLGEGAVVARRTIPVGLGLRSQQGVPDVGRP